MRRLAAALVVGSALALSGCATNRIAPVQVTRFHLNQPIAPAAITVEPRNPQDANSLEFQVYANAVQGELVRLGFRPEPGTSSELVALVDVSRGSREEMARRSPISIGLGGGFGGGGWRGGGVGLGGGLSFPLGRGRARQVVLTDLGVQIKRRSEGTVIWEGRARGEAPVDRPEAEPDTAGQRLAAAIFSGFPGESGRTVEVR